VHFPHFLRHVNRVFTNRVMGTFAWLVPPLAVVHHVGRKSGQAYRTPVVAFPSAEGFVIPLTYGRDVDWARNLVAAGSGELERAGGRVPLVRPHIVGFDEAAPHLSAAARMFFRPLDLPGFVLADTQA
jgi:deazaflavin-dependent oxidoreductase (nitroreductase family)